jgi:multiple sugar transport system permease protein
MTDAKLSHFSDDLNPPRERPRILSIVIHTALILASIVMLYPLLWMLSGSVKDQNEIFGTASLIPSQFDFSSFARGWSGGQVSFGSFIWNSVVIAVLSVLGNVISCSLAAYAFARLKFWGRNFWFALMLGTLMLPYHVTLIPQYILFLKLGWVKTMLPLVVPKFLAVDAFFIFLMVQFFRGIPRELDEAAMMDGCSRFQALRRVMIPLMGPGILTAGIFVFLFAFQEYLTATILTDVNARTVPVFIATQLGQTLPMLQQAGAAAVLFTIPAIAFAFIAQKYIVAGLNAGSVKG